MKSCFLNNAEQMSCLDQKSSDPIISVQTCGICHSDRKAFKTPPSGMTMPRVLGHEICGVLRKTLPGKDFNKGDCVAVWPAITCGICKFCKSGRKNLCPEIKLFGFHLDGGFATACGHPSLDNRLILLHIPPALSFRQAVFAEPIGCVLHGLGKVQIKPDNILIYGSGTMGRLAARSASQLWPGVEISITDIDHKRLQLAKEDGSIAATNSLFDAVFIAASSANCFKAGIEALAPGGTMVLFSGFPGEEKLVSFNQNLFHQKEQTMVGSYGCLPQDMSRGLDLMADGKLVIDDLISHCISIDQLPAELARETISSDFKSILITE